MDGIQNLIGLSYVCQEADSSLKLHNSIQNGDVTISKYDFIVVKELFLSMKITVRHKIPLNRTIESIETLKYFLILLESCIHQQHNPETFHVNLFVFMIEIA